MKSFGVTGEDFQSFGYFQRGDQIDDGAEDPDGVASFLEALGSGAGFEKAGEAGGCAGANGHGQAVAGNGSRVNPRGGGFYGDVIDQEAGFGIIPAAQ